MRVTSQMQNLNYLNMINSKSYKNHLDKVDSEEENAEDQNIKQVTDKVIVEKKEDDYILSRVDGPDEKTVISTVKLDSKLGLQLSKYYQSDEANDLNQRINSLNQSIRSMSLTDYL